ncbi:MAG: BON domain-containing protein [Bacteroidales bacterium]|nr:BON domain-containing protein [Bacteroidales bacterium]
MNSTPHPSRARAFGRYVRDPRLLVAFVALLFGLAPQPASSQPFPASTANDTLLAFQVKSALAADSVLAPVNLFVSVVDRVAVVGGPVPDAATIARVEWVIRGVPGLTEVKVHCWVALREDGFGGQVREAMILPPTAVPPLVYPTTPGQLRVDPQLMAWNPGSPSQGRSDSVVAQRPSQPPLAGFLLDPVVTGAKPSTPLIPELPMPGQADAMPNIPPQQVPVSPVVNTAPTLEQQVSTLRASNPRFGWLTIRLENGTATVSGHATHIQDAEDYAAALRNIPGIHRVVIGEVLPK